MYICNKKYICFKNCPESSKWKDLNKFKINLFSCEIISEKRTKLQSSNQNMLLNFNYETLMSYLNTIKNVEIT